MANPVIPDGFEVEQKQTSAAAIPQGFEIEPFGSEKTGVPAAGRPPTISALLPDPQQAVARTTENARQLADALTRPPIQPPIPLELRDRTPQELAQPTGRFNPRTGAPITVGMEQTRIPVLDSPTEGGKQVMGGVVQMSRPELREKAGGASHVIQGGLTIAEPAMVAGALTSPIHAAVALGRGVASQAATQATLKRLGVPDEYADLAGEVAGIAGASFGGKATGALKGKIREILLDKIKERNAREAAKVAPESRQVQDGAIEPSYRVISPEEWAVEQSAKSSSPTASRSAEPAPKSPRAAETRTPNTAEDAVRTRMQEVVPPSSADMADAPASQTVQEGSQKQTSPPVLQKPDSLNQNTLAGETKPPIPETVQPKGEAKQPVSDTMDQQGETPAKVVQANVSQEEADRGGALSLSRAKPGKPGITLETEDHPSGRGKQVVARDENGKPVGVLSFTANDELTGPAPKEHGAYPQVYVEPNSRRRGIATEMYRAAKDAGFDLSELSGTETSPMGAALVNSMKNKARRIYGKEIEIAEPEKSPTPSNAEAKPEAPQQKQPPSTPAPSKNPTRLREAAAKIKAAADEQLGRDRQTNTRKRVEQAASSINAANADAATARTMERIAEAIDDGSLANSKLRNVSSRADVDALNAVLRKAMRERDANLPYAEQQKRIGRPADEEDFKLVKFPTVGLHGSRALDIIKLLDKNAKLKRWAAKFGSDKYHILSPDDYANAREVIKALKDKPAAKWAIDSLKSDLQDVDRMARITETTGFSAVPPHAELQKVIRDLAPLKAAKAKLDPVKAAEMAIVGKKVGIDFFPTPSHLAKRMAELADVGPGKSVLEPSAGNGNLADAAKAAGGDVHTVEISSDLREILKAKGHTIAGENFDDFSARKQYDAVIMNPPFSNRLDAEHIAKAFGLVKPGGKLVAIAGEGVFNGNDKKAVGFRQWLQDNGAKVEKLPEGTFSATRDKSLLAQTGANGRLIVMHKPAAAPAPAPAAAPVAHPKAETKQPVSDTMAQLDETKGKVVRSGFLSGKPDRYVGFRGSSEDAPLGTEKMGGTFVAERHDYASNFAKEDGKVVHRTQVDVAKPFVLQDQQNAAALAKAEADAIGDPSQADGLARMYREQGMSHLSRTAKQWLISKGYDAVVSDRDLGVGTSSGPVMLALDDSKVKTSPIAYGKATEIAVPGEKARYPAKYAVMELADVQASHNAHSFEPNPDYEHLNDRDYKQPANAARVIDNAQQFDPAYVLSDSPTAEQGATIVDPRGNALGGNNRAMTLGRVYEHHPEAAAKYRQQLAEKAQSFGINPEDLSRFKNPVLVRERTGAVDPQREITDYNKVGAAKLNPGEQAVTDGRRLSDKTIEKLTGQIQDAGENGSLADALRGDSGGEIVNQLVKDGVITDAEKNGLVDERDQLTAEGKARIAKALVGRMFESPEHWNQTPPEMRNKLEKIAPHVLRVEGRAEWNITEPVREALKIVETAREHGVKNMYDLVNQPDLNGKVYNFSPKAMELANILNQGPNKAAAAFRQYANDEVLSREGAQATFFEPPTQPEAWAAAFEKGSVLSQYKRPMLADEVHENTATYDRNQGIKTTIANVRIDKIELEPEHEKTAIAIVGNDHLVEYMGRRLLNQNGLGARSAGLHVEPGLAWRLAVLARTDGLKQLQVVASQAAAHGKSLVIVNDDPAQRNTPSAPETLEHELNHSLQRALSPTGYISEHLGDEATLDLLADKLGRRAVRALSRLGYGNMSAAETVAEIGVRLMNPAEVGDLKLSEDEARTLAAHYLRGLRKEHGHAAPKVIARKVFTALRRGDRASTGQRSERTGVLRQERQPGAQSLFGADVPGPGAERGNTNARAKSALPARNEAQQGLFGSDEVAAANSGQQSHDAKLLGDQLTAQFGAPITKAEQGRKLKRDKTSQQTDMFSPDAGPGQGVLFNLKKANNSIFGDDGPKANYSGLGVLKNALVRNLSQLEMASPKGHEAAVRAAASRAQAAVILRGAVPRIQDALEGSGISWQEFRQGLMESRLRGIRERWQDIARQAERSKDLDLHKAFENGLGDLLDNIAGKKDLPQNLKQTAAAMLQKTEPNLLNPSGTPQYEELRQFLSQTFNHAANSVGKVMEQDRFNAVLNSSEAKEALRIYKQLVEAPIAKNHALNEGIFSTAKGPLDTYYPLIPIDQKAPVGPGHRIPFRRPANIANKFATGLSEEYDDAVKPFADRLTAAIRINDRAALFDALGEEGLLHVLPHGAIGNTFQPAPPKDATYFRDMTEYEGVRVEIKPGRQIIQNGKTTHVPATNAMIPRWLHTELKPILEGEPAPRNLAMRIVSAMNTFAISGPADFVWHTRNLLGTLVGNTPYLGNSLGGKAASLPFVKTFAAIVKTMQIDPTTPENVADLQAMARAGMLPSSYAAETFSKRAAEELGSERVRFSLSPMLYGPKGVDVRARLLMYRIGKQAVPNATPKDLANFVNQLSIRVPELQSGVERSLKAYGLAPFATAGTQSLRNGINAWLGTGPMPRKGWDLRVWQQLTGGGVALAAVWAITHHQTTGKWPWEDRTARFMKIPVPQQYRHTALGNGLWGHSSTTGYVDMTFFNSMGGRGARTLGITGAIDTKTARGSLGQQVEAAQRDMINSLAHPALGPLPKAAWVGITGTEPYMTSFRDQRGQMAPQFFPAVPKSKPGLDSTGKRALAAVKEMNSFYGNVGALTGFGPQEGRDEGNKWLRMLVDLVAPGLVGRASNPYSRAGALERERAATSRR